MRNKVKSSKAFEEVYNELSGWMHGNDYNGDLEFAFRNDFQLWAVYLWQGSGASNVPSVMLPKKQLEAERRQLVQCADIFVCSSCNHHSFFEAGEILEDETECESCLKTMKIYSRGES